MWGCAPTLTTRQNCGILPPVVNGIRQRRLGWVYGEGNEVTEPEPKYISKEER
jgi:hypothetical protein